MVSESSNEELVNNPLSNHHRAINGVYAAQFISDLGLALSDVLLIEENFK